MPPVGCCVKVHGFTMVAIHQQYLQSDRSHFSTDEEEQVNSMARLRSYVEMCLFIYFFLRCFTIIVIIIAIIVFNQQNSRYPHIQNVEYIY